MYVLQRILLNVCVSNLAYATPPGRWTETTRSTQVLQRPRAFEQLANWFKSPCYLCGKKRYFYGYYPQKVMFNRQRFVPEMGITNSLRT